MKKVPSRPERSKSIARWENEGGAGRSLPQEERQAAGTRDEKSPFTHPKGRQVTALGETGRLNSARGARPL